MNDNEIGNPPIKALIVFKDNGDTDNLYVPILCDAIRTTGIDVRCSTNEFWDSDTPYDIIHFQWPEEVMGWNCDDPDRIRRLEERITFSGPVGPGSCIRATMSVRMMRTR